MPPKSETGHLFPGGLEALKVQPQPIQKPAAEALRGAAGRATAPSPPSSPLGVESPRLRAAPTPENRAKVLYVVWDGYQRVRGVRNTLGNDYGHRAVT